MFVFEKVEYEIKWGLNGANRSDVTDANANPFPLNPLMPANSTESQKKTQAKDDLTPNQMGVTPRNFYWSSALTTQHELFHVADWKDYYKEYANEAKAWIDIQEEGVTLENLVPGDVLAVKKQLFINKLIEKTLEANTEYREDNGHEIRAYGDGKAGYQALADSINP